MKTIVFFWDGLTAYGARALDVLREKHADVHVVATVTEFPYEGVERLFKGRLTWVKADDGRTLSDVCGPDYGIVYTSGWNIPVFNRFCREARSAGRPVVCCLDNNWERSLKAVLRVVRFRLMQRRLFDAFFVPGKSGMELLRRFGVPAGLVRTGFYAGDDRTFRCGAAPERREKRMICVGQMIARKNVEAVAKAFLAVSGDFPDWMLEFCGSGPLRDRLPDSPKIIVNDFLQPPQLAAAYRRAKVFVLASLQEHWGVVVHEAALSGCAMLLSDRVGSAPDFLTDRNGYSFRPASVRSLAGAMRKIMAWPPGRFREAREASLRCAAGFGGEVFAEHALSLARQLGAIDP